MSSMMRRFALAATVLLIPLVSPGTALGQNGDERIEALQKGQEEIRKELAEIKQLLQGRRQAPAGPDVAGKVFDLGENPIRGESTASLVLVEFSDYQ